MAQEYIVKVPPGTSWIALAHQHNICVDAISRANPQIIERASGFDFSWQTEVEIVLPDTGQSCYQAVELEEPLPYSELVEYVRQHFPDLKICDEAILKHNFDYYDLNWENPNGTLTRIYLPLLEPPCYNVQGQRLKYPIEDNGFYNWLAEAPYYTTDQIYRVKADDLPIEGRHSISDAYYIAYQHAWCYDVFRKANLSMRRLADSWGVGFELFLPEEVTDCRLIPMQRGDTLYLVSKRENICIEDLMQTNWVESDYVYDTEGSSIVFRTGAVDMGYSSNMRTLMVRRDAPPCYGADGKRLHHKDKATHFAQPGDTFYKLVP